VFFVLLYITVLLCVSLEILWITLVQACYPPHRLKDLHGRPIGGE
jgi:hypothetical protein